MSKIEKRKLISEIIGNNPRTVENHTREERHYIKLFDYFSIEELQYFLTTGKIEKLELIKNIQLEQLKNSLSEGYISEEKKIKDILFKIEFGMDEKFVLPIFKEAILHITPNENTIFEDIKNKISTIKLGFFGHENHRKITIEFVEKYLSAQDLIILNKHFLKKTKG